MISAIVISRNEGRWLRGTVENLQDTLPPDSEIVVVDDGSTDGSVEFLARRRRSPLLVRGSGLGVAGARNLGASFASGDLLIFADAHIGLPAGWWRPLAAVLDDPRVGAASPAISSTREADRLGYGLTLPKPDLQAEWLPRRNGKPRAVPVLPGACMAIRRRVFQASGGYDGGMLASGCVDNEFCFRLFRMGFEQWVLPEVAVKHRFRKRVPYPLEWETVLHNRLRFALVHLSPERVAKVARSLSSWAGFGQAMIRAVSSDVARRRKRLESKKHLGDHLFFERFGLHW